MKKMFVAVLFAAAAVPLSACCVNPLLCVEVCAGCATSGILGAAPASVEQLTNNDLPMRVRQASAVVAMAY